MTIKNNYQILINNEFAYVESKMYLILALRPGNIRTKYENKKTINIIEKNEFEIFNKDGENIGLFVSKFNSVDRENRFLHLDIELKLNTYGENLQINNDFKNLSQKIEKINQKYKEYNFLFKIKKEKCFFDEKIITKWNFYCNNLENYSKVFRELNKELKEVYLLLNNLLNNENYNFKTYVYDQEGFYSQKKINLRQVNVIFDNLVFKPITLTQKEKELLNVLKNKEKNDLIKYVQSLTDKNIQESNLIYMIYNQSTDSYVKDKNEHTLTFSDAKLFATPILAEKFAKRITNKYLILESEIKFKNIYSNPEKLAPGVNLQPIISAKEKRYIENSLNKKEDIPNIPKTEVKKINKI